MNSQSYNNVASQEQKKKVRKIRKENSQPSETQINYIFNSFKKKAFTKQKRRKIMKMRSQEYKKKSVLISRRSFYCSKLNNKKVERGRVNFWLAGIRFNFIIVLG